MHRTGHGRPYYIATFTILVFIYTKSIVMSFNSQQKEYRGISKNFSYNGFKFLEQQGNFLVFTRYNRATGKTQAMKCTIEDMTTGYFYKLADAGLSRI